MVSVIKRFSWALVILLVSSRLLAETAFTRVETQDNNTLRALQVAVVSYQRPDQRSSPRVDLISAVHVGDKDYYQQLNKLFESYDALLYELVAPEGAQRPSLKEDGSSLSGAQSGLARLLELSFQLDEIDYSAENFIHADFTPSQMREAMEERNESLYSYFWESISASFRQQVKDPFGRKAMANLGKVMAADGRNRLKLLMAYEFAELGSFQDTFGDDASSALIGGRNQRAIEVLTETLAKGDKNIGIFYGAAHMPDFEDRLAEMGFEPVASSWLDAWLL